MSQTTKPHPSASLYVGDLPPTVTEGMLFEIFNHVGPLASIRVCRDTLTRRSLGYAYVNFHSVVDAERALDTLNNTPIKGKPCRIMWSQRDPSVRKSGVGNIFIKNLDPAVGHKELYDTFSAFGNILSCKVAMDETGASKGFGFVHYENAESADGAIRTVNEKVLGSKKVFVGKFVPKKERMQQKEASWTNVYVKELDPSVTDQELELKFTPFGLVTSCVIMRGDEGESKGFGFVNFGRHEDAVNAVEGLQGLVIGGKPIWCGRAQKKTERESELKKKFKQLKMEHMTRYQGINLYIKNLEDDIDEDRLRKEFSAFGQIRSAKIMSDEKGNSKGFGFICYSTPEEAQHAINEMNSRILQGCQKPLYVALHEPKEVRRQKLAQRHANRTKHMRPNLSNVPVGPGVFGAPPPVYYPAPGGNQFVYQQPPQPTMVPRQPTRGPWPNPQQPQQYPIQTGAPQYVQTRPNRGRGGGQLGSGGGRGRSNNRKNTPIGPGQEAVGLVPGELTLQQLDAYPPDQQKLLLGERLYPLIQKVQSPLAGKITGMLLDSGWSIEELFSLLNDEEKLSVKIEEAVSVLNRAQQQDETVNNEYRGHPPDAPDSH